MSKTITVRLSDEDYAIIADRAKKERRPISNYITHFILNGIANFFVTDDEETAEILNDKELMEDLKQSQKDFKEGRYRIVK